MLCMPLGRVKKRLPVAAVEKVGFIEFLVAHRINNEFSSMKGADMIGYMALMKCTVIS